MDSFYRANPSIDGVKGLVIIGSSLVTYRRDTNTKIAPLKVDLPGGKVESGETPFEAFRRETKEEFNIDIARDSIVYVKLYPQMVVESESGPIPIAEYFPVAQLPEDAKRNLKLGDEGTNCTLMSIEEYLALDDAIPEFQKRTAEFASSWIDRPEAVLKS